MLAVLVPLLQHRGFEQELKPESGGSHGLNAAVAGWLRVIHTDTYSVCAIHWSQHCFQISNCAAVAQLSLRLLQHALTVCKL